MPGSVRGLGSWASCPMRKSCIWTVSRERLRILSYLKPYWLQFLLVFLTILLSAAVGLLPSIITGKIVDEALFRQILDCEMKKQ